MNLKVLQIHNNHYGLYKKIIKKNNKLFSKYLKHKKESDGAQYLKDIKHLILLNKNNLKKNL